MVSFEDKFLQIHPDTVMTLKKLYNLEKREDMERAIDVLEDWLKKQHHLTKREYPRDFLERSIILMKGSVEQTKSQIDSLCSMRALYPKFFEKYDARNDFNELDSIALCAVLPKLTKDHYRIYVSRLIEDGITPELFLDAFRFGFLKSEYVKAHDYCNGFQGILDFRNINMVKLISNIDPVTMQQFLNILMKGYGMRIKGIHIVTPSKAVETFIKILKPMFGLKVSKRIYVHATIETLYDHVPKNLLPSELGGCERSMYELKEQWKDILGTKENVNYMKEMSKNVSNEAYRIKDTDLGATGTFRSLCVD